jgi:hypothetical protein
MPMMQGGYMMALQIGMIALQMEMMALQMGIMAPQMGIMAPQMGMMYHPSMYQSHLSMLMYGGGFPMAPAGSHGGAFMPNQFYPNPGFSNIANQASSSTSDESTDSDED